MDGKDQHLHAAPAPGGFRVVQSHADQLARLGRFKDDNPDWRIACDRDNRAWAGMRQQGTQDEIHVRFSLESLLDTLEGIERAENP